MMVPAHADDCATLVEKSRSVVEAMMKDTKQPYGDKERKEAIEGCRKEVKGKTDPTFAKNMKCVLQAKTKKAVEDCWFQNYGIRVGGAKTVVSEAKRELTRLAKNAKVTYVTSAEFPKGSVGPTPAGKACCKQKDKRCAAGDWTAQLWTDLDFAPDGPTQFQYTYTSDGKKGSATAVGDLECDGKLETYKLTLSVENGEPTYKLVEPPAKSSKP